MEQKQQRNENGKVRSSNLTELMIAVMAAVTVVVVVLILLTGKSLGSKQVAEVLSKDGETAGQTEEIDATPSDILVVGEGQDETTTGGTSPLVIPDKGGENTADGGNTLIINGNEDSTSDPETPTTPAITQPQQSTMEGEGAGLQRMTEDEFTQCWYNDPYLSKLPLIGFGTYEAILQKEAFSVAMISNIQKDKVKSYCEETGSEGSLDLNGFTENAKVVKDNDAEYAYQVTNKDGMTVYISWTGGIASFTIGVD